VPGLALRILAEGLVTPEVLVTCGVASLDKADGTPYPRRTRR
jgi:hypothetical protein